MFKDINTLDRIYEAAFGNMLYETVLDIFSQNLPGTAIVLFGQDSLRPAGNFLLHRGLNDDAVVSSVTSLAVGNPWFEKQWEQIKGAVYQDNDIVMPEENVAPEKLKSWRRIMGNMTHATGIVISRQRTRQLVLEIRFPDEGEAKLRRKATEMLDTLAPHLVKAAKIMSLNNHSPLHAQMTGEVLELFPFPVLIIDTAFRIHGMNESATIMANRMDTFFVSADGRFHAVNLDKEHGFRDIVQQVANGTARTSNLIPFPNNDTSSQVFMSLTKLGLSHNLTNDISYAFEKQGERIAISVLDMSEPLKLNHSVLWNAFKLTNAESDLVSMLLQGCTIGDCAQKCNLAKQTLRNQLGSIMKKTDTHRQAQLVSLLTRMALSSAV